MLRGIDLRGGIALNVISMIGIGPLVTIPLVLAQLHGATALLGWVAGAIVALCDGLCWAALASRFPGAGGTYAYLRDAFGEAHYGRFAAFLYNWQAFLAGGFLLSTGCIGFAAYAAYLYPPAQSNSHVAQAIAVGVALCTIVLAYRNIRDISLLSVLLCVVAVMTVVLVGAAGMSHGTFAQFHGTSTSGSFGLGFVAALGSALFVTLYDYGGYSTVAVVAEEVREPRRTIPLAIIISIGLVFALYVFLQIGVLMGLPSGPLTQYVGSDVVEHAWGRPAATVVTIMVLITAFASVFGGLVGYARVPYAAARDGVFVPVFARLHPRGQFPSIAVIGVGLVMIAGCFFDLNALIALLSAAGILLGSIGQIVALFIIHARGQGTPFRMWLYPLPAVVALAGWIYAYVSTGIAAILGGLAWMLLGAGVYAIVRSTRRA